MDGGSRDLTRRRRRRPSRGGRRPWMTSRLRSRGGVPMSRPGSHPRHRTRMPTSARKPSPHVFTGSAELNATVEQVAPSILELLADGMPRTKPTIVEALAGRHDKQDVVHALIRLAVTGRVEESGGRYALATSETG